MLAAMLALVTMTRALSALASIPPARIVVPNVDAVAAQIGSAHYTRLPAVCWFGTFDVQICRMHAAQLQSTPYPPCTY